MAQRKAHHGPHKYRRIIYGKNETPIYRCLLPGCLHYIGEDFILGQTSLCNRCGGVFVIGKAMLFPRKIVKPHCEGCNRPTFNKIAGRVMKGPAVKEVTHHLSDADILDLIPGEQAEE